MKAPFTNLSFGTKELNFALKDIEKIPLKGLKTKILQQAYGALQGLEGQ